MSLEDIARRDMARITERNTLVAALRNAESEYGFAQIEAARAMSQEREAAFKRAKELEGKAEKARQALDEYDKAARQTRGWPT